MYLQAKPLLWFLSPIIISGVPCFASPLAGRFSWSWAASLVIWLLARWVSQFSVLSVATTSAFGSCLPNAVSSELCCLAPEQAKSKHCTLWLKGHLSRGGNPASPPKSINRGRLLSRGAAHCHGNAPSEWGSGPNPAPSHLHSCFLGLHGCLCILTACLAERGALWIKFNQRWLVSCSDGGLQHVYVR